LFVSPHWMESRTYSSQVSLEINQVNQFAYSWMLTDIYYFLSREYTYRKKSEFFPRRHKRFLIIHLRYTYMKFFIVNTLRKKIYLSCERAEKCVISSISIQSSFWFSKRSKQVRVAYKVPQTYEKKFFYYFYLK